MSNGSSGVNLNKAVYDLPSSSSDELVEALLTKYQVSPKQQWSPRNTDKKTQQFVGQPFLDESNSVQQVNDDSLIEHSMQALWKKVQEQQNVIDNYSKIEEEIIKKHNEEKKVLQEKIFSLYLTISYLEDLMIQTAEKIDHQEKKNRMLDKLANVVLKINHNLFQIPKSQVNPDTKKKILNLLKKQPTQIKLKEYDALIERNKVLLQELSNIKEKQEDKQEEKQEEKKKEKQKRSLIKLLRNPKTKLEKQLNLKS